MAPAPVPTRNRFEALADRCILDSDGAQISREMIVDLELLIKPKNPNKKRMGESGTFSYVYIGFWHFGKIHFRALSKFLVGKPL